MFDWPLTIGEGSVGIVIPIGRCRFSTISFAKSYRSETLFISLFWGMRGANGSRDWYGPVIWRKGAIRRSVFYQAPLCALRFKQVSHWRPVYYYLIVNPLPRLAWNAFPV